MEEFVFDPKRDLFEVDQFGFVNAREAYASGVVSGDTPASAEAFNGASPDSLLPRPDDLFAGKRQQKYVRSTLKQQAEAEAAAASAAGSGASE